MKNTQTFFVTSGLLNAAIIKSCINMSYQQQASTKTPSINEQKQFILST